MDISPTFTFADYLTWNDGNLYELIKGKLYKMSPAPSEDHQWLSSKLFKHAIDFIFGKKRKCRIYHAPFDVRLPRKGGSNNDNDIYTVVQPDICVVCDLTKIDRRGCLGAPDLIVEILSVGTAKKDLNEKFNLYQESGVKEYWVVFPEAKAIVVYLLTDTGLYDEGTTYEQDQTLRSVTLEGLEIDLKNIFEEG